MLTRPHNRLAEPCDAIDHAIDWTIEDEAVRALTTLTGFEAAMQAGASALVDLQRDNWILNRVINDRGRSIAALTMLDLHLTGGETGFTVTDLRTHARLRGFGSPNRVTALSGALRAGNFLIPVAATDSRLRKLAPTERFITLYQRLFTVQLQAQAMVRPQIVPAVAAIAETRFFGDFLHGLLMPCQSAEQASWIDPGLDALAERANATMMLYAIFVADASGTAIVMSELARRFAVARSHVVSVMKEAEAYGLMVPDRPARTFRPTARLRQALQLAFASNFLLQAKAYDYALARQNGGED